MEKVPDTKNAYLYNEFHYFGRFLGEQNIKITAQLMSMPFEKPHLVLKKAVLIFSQKGAPDQEIDVTMTICFDQDWIDRVHNKFERARQRAWTEEEAG